MGMTDPAAQLSQQVVQQMEITTLGIVNHVQDVLKGQNINMFDKSKYITPLVQSINQLYSLVLTARQAGDPQLEQQKAQHQYAMDLMAQHHEEQMNERKMQHEQMLAEMKAQIEAAKSQQEMQQSQEAHQQNLAMQEEQAAQQKENNTLQQAVTIQQQQQGEEKHQREMSNSQEAHEKAMKEPPQKPSGK